MSSVRKPTKYYALHVQPMILENWLRKRCVILGDCNEASDTLEKKCVI